MDGDAGGNRPAPLLPLQVDRIFEPVMIAGLHIESARLARSGRQAPWLYTAALKGSDLKAGRGGFGLSRDEAVMDLFRYLRFLSAARPLQ